MADDVQDVYIATEAGDAGWQSLTELTASKVDAKLPIESEDGTVVLSDSSGSFVVSTVGEERVKVTDKGYVGFNCDPTYRFQVQGVNNSGDLTTDRMLYSGGILYCQNTADATIGFYFQTNTSGGSATRSTWGLTTQYPSVGKDSNLELRNTGFTLGGGDAPPSFSFTTEKNFIVHEGQVQTPSVSGLNANDASIALGAELLTTNHTPTQPNSIATKKTVDDKIQVMTTAEYLAIDVRDLLPTTLYCLTD